MDGVREYRPGMSDAEIIDDAYELWEEIDAYEAASRKQMVEALEFQHETQWDPDDEDSRGDTPTLTIPRMNQFLNHVKNDARQNKPGIKTSPSDDKADIKAAETRSGLIKHIQYDSQAVDAYQTAFDFAVECGRGWIRINTEWTDYDSMDQKIVIDQIVDPLNVYPDRNVRKKDYSDMKHCFILETMPKKIFKKKYPKASPGEWTRSFTDCQWITPDDITVAEFYCTWAWKRRLVQLKSGMDFGNGRGTQEGALYFWDQFDDLTPETKEEIENNIMRYPNGKKVERTVLFPKVMYYKMTRGEILERKAILGYFVPMIPLIGYETRVRGKLNIKGMVKGLIDTQKLYNFWCSQEALLLSLAPRAKYMVAVGQMEGLEDEYEAANRTNTPYLQYHPVSVDGQLVPVPRKEVYEGPPAALLTAKMGCVDDMKAVAGIFDPSMGNIAPERSGRAILATQKESDIANYHFVDNMRICLTHAGRVINNWLSDIYTPGRIIRILGTENEEKQVRLGDMDEKQEEITLGDGKYDVVVSMGPSYNTQRQESAEFMMQLVKAVPQIAPLIYDLLVKNIDSAGAQEIYERLKKTIPPELLQEQGGEAQLRRNLMQATQQLQQSQQMIQLLSQQLEATMADLKEENEERANKLQIAKINAQAKIAVENIKAQQQQAGRLTDIYMNFFKTISPVQVQKGE